MLLPLESQKPPKALRKAVRSRPLTAARKVPLSRFNRISLVCHSPDFAGVVAMRDSRDPYGLGGRGSRRAERLAKGGSAGASPSQMRA